jgi:hypothetical protein
MLRVLFIGLFAFHSHAQLVLNDVVNLDKAPLVFDTEFIRLHNIKSIKGRVSNKRPNSPIRATNLYLEYFFDEQGRIIRSQETLENLDIVYREYFYNDRGWLFYQGIETSEKLNYETYLMNEKGQIVEIDNFERRKDNMGIPMTVEGDKEMYDLQSTDSSRIRIIKNKLGTAYMKEESFLRADGKVGRIEKRYLATGEGTIQYFEYNNKGNILSITLLSSKQKIEKEKYTFEYDILGNLKVKKYFEKGIFIKESQYIVNESNGLLTALLEQTESTNNLRIVRFETYGYYY